MTSWQIDVRGVASNSIDEYWGASLLKADMPLVVLMADESTTLSDIVSKAEAQLGLTDLPYAGLTIVFGHELKEFYSYLMPDSHGDYLTVVDDSGAVRWWVPRDEWNTITYPNLLESYRAGLIGDPSEIRIIKTHQYGNGIPPMDWDLFFTALGNISAILGLTGTAYKGVTVLKNRFQNWRDRRAKPQDVFNFIIDRPSWDIADLAKRLAIPTDDAKAVLELFGYSLDNKTQLYRRDDSGRTSKVRSELKDAFENYEGD